MTVFMDGTCMTPGTDGCKCGPACEHPCWARLGTTTDACCPGCPPLPDPDDLDTDAIVIPFPTRNVVPIRPDAA